MLPSGARQRAPDGTVQAGEQSIVSGLPLHYCCFQNIFLAQSLIRINDKIACWCALTTKLITVACSAPHTTSCWNIRLWLKKEKFVDLHDVAVHHMRARWLGCTPSITTPKYSSITPLHSAFPRALCGQKIFVKVVRGCQKYPGRLADDSVWPQE